jgi:hypothetical protein
MTMKDPDALDYAIRTKLEDLNMECDEGSEFDRDEEAICDELRATAQVWMNYGEYITVEFDTENGTCTVLKP